jgi:hypothetical protein
MGITHRKCHRDEPGYLRGSDVTARWGLLYNLYPDRLLGFNMFPQSVYETREFFLVHIVLCQLDSNRPMAETKWYSTKIDEYGIRLDSR